MSLKNSKGEVLMCCILNLHQIFYVLLKQLFSFKDFLLKKGMNNIY